MPKPSKPTLSINEPTIAIEKTEALRDGWVASGRVIYPVDSPRTNGTVLEVSFKDAPSRNDAIQQSLSDLEALIDALSATVARLRQDERPNGDARARLDPTAVSG